MIPSAFLTDTCDVANRDGQVLVSGVACKFTLASPELANFYLGSAPNSVWVVLLNNGPTVDEGYRLHTTSRVYTVQAVYRPAGKFIKLIVTEG